MAGKAAGQRSTSRMENARPDIRDGRSKKRLVRGGMSKRPLLPAANQPPYGPRSCGGP